MFRVEAPAKINLFLRVLVREDSGYHQLETLFQALEVGDSLSLRPGDRGIVLDLDGPPMGPVEENLVFRAARAFLDAAGLESGLEIRLKKRLPLQAGLGGGSSDAAAVLKGLERLFPGHLGPKELLSLAAGLGSDVPFFLSPSPLALAWGRGQRVLPLPHLPSVSVLLAIPPKGVSTPEAYRLLSETRMKPGQSPVPAVHELQDFSTWEHIAGIAENHFEEVVLPLDPMLGGLKDAFEREEPRFALLSGSGSALFAIFEAEGAAEEARLRLRRSFPSTRFLLTRTLESFPDPTSQDPV